MKTFLGMLIFSAAAVIASQNAKAVETPAPSAPIEFLNYDYWRVTNPGESCQFTPECDQNENCMEDNTCSPAKCDDTHKCVIGEICDTGFCHA